MPGSNQRSRLPLKKQQVRKKSPLKPESRHLAPKMDPRIWHKVAAVSGIVAVGLGAYGAHGFKPKDTVYKQVWQTASLYHLVHTAALLAAPLTNHPKTFGGLLTGGIVLFSGSCYVVALLEDRKYSRLAPIGGFAFMAAWGTLLF